MECKYCKQQIPDGSIYCNYCGKKQEPSHTRRRRSNGEGTVYLRGSTYTAKHTIYRNGSQITRTKGGFKTRKEAYAWLASSTVLETRPERITFRQLYEKWSKKHYENITPKKATAYKAAYRTAAILNHYFWDEISLEMMQDAVDRALNTYNQRKIVKLVLHMMEDYANINGYGERHITQYIKLPAQTKPNRTAFTKEEIKNLFKGWEHGDRWAGIILIMIYTGMRYGEISTVDPDNIHLDQNYLIGGIKTEAGKLGEIILLDEIKPIVQKLMIPNTIGSVSTTTFTKHFKECLARNGCREHTSHECRHTTASLLAEAGTNGMIIKDILRHSSYAQAEPYTHTTRAEKIRALKTALDFT